jgi:hypothetical protein
LFGFLEFFFFWGFFFLGFFTFICYNNKLGYSSSEEDGIDPCQINVNFTNFTSIQATGDFAAIIGSNPTPKPYVIEITQVTFTNITASQVVYRGALVNLFITGNGSVQLSQSSFTNLTIGNSSYGVVAAVGDTAKFFVSQSIAYFFVIIIIIIILAISFICLFFYLLQM